jgi:Emfourin
LIQEQETKNDSDGITGMIIKIERSGGIGGIVTTKKANVEMLPPPFIEIVKSLVNKSNSISMKNVPKGAADFYNYRITVDDGSAKHTIMYNEYNISDKVKELIKYVEKNSMKSQQ